jgi:hypothetical protein
MEEEGAQEMTEFKVGDKVRTVGKTWGRYAGKEGFVTDRVTVSGQQFMRLDGSDIDWAFDIIRPVELVEAANVAQEETNEKPDAINPPHYQGFSNGAQVIDITENLNFNRGNAVKYLARAGAKEPAKEIEDLEKSLWYTQRELDRLKGLRDA